MIRISWFSPLAVVALSASVSLASAQQHADTFYRTALTGDAVAYVYVSSSPTSTRNLISAYSAGPTGQLTSIAGSPFLTQGDGALTLALNGAWLFGTNVNSDLYTFSIADNGALKQTGNLDIGHVTSSVEEGPEALFLDHTGATLYVGYMNYPPDCGNPGEVAYSIDQKNGKLTYVNNICVPPQNGASGSGMSFIGNNKFAYTSGCYDISFQITGVERSSDGALTVLNNSAPMPPPTSNGGYYFPCAGGAAADPANNFALALQPFTESIGPTPDGPFQIATYTVDSSGNLTTNSTPENMPSVAVGNVSDYWMSPDGKYLAVSGSGGVQVLHWNGASPATSFTGLLTTASISQVFWDDEHHLYALSGGSAGKLYVFTVSTFGATQAPGSPYSIPGAGALIVLPRQASTGSVAGALLQGWK
jgi:hypothetical protein